MIPTSAATQTTTSGYGAHSAPRQRLTTTPATARTGMVNNGAQDDLTWLWRCVEQADTAGYDARAAVWCGRAARASHDDTYRVPSVTTRGRAYRVTYTPHRPQDASASYAHDGAWRCGCSRGAVGAPCLHIGAAYLAACQRDARRSLEERIRQAQAQADAIEEAIRYQQQRYRAAAAQLAQLQAEAARTFSRVTTGATIQATIQTTIGRMFHV